VGYGHPGGEFPEPCKQSLHLFPVGHVLGVERDGDEAGAVNLQCTDAFLGALSHRRGKKSRSTLLAKLVSFFLNFSMISRHLRVVAARSNLSLLTKSHETFFGFSRGCCGSSSSSSSSSSSDSGAQPETELGGEGVFIIIIPTEKKRKKRENEGF
jgi:hypothetical protein